MEVKLSSSKMFHTFIELILTPVFKKLNKLKEITILTYLVHYSCFDYIGGCSHRGSNQTESKIKISIKHLYISTNFHEPTLHNQMTSNESGSCLAM